jgi:adenylate cyclase
MSETILNQAGTIDKFIGDAIMAIFGAPVPTQEHAKKACMTALGMVRELHKMNQELASQSKPPIDIGIGLNTGEMTVGNIGSERRFDYTVIGDAVNLGARLEGLNKNFGTHILVSEFTKNQVNEVEFIFREIATVKVKGKENPVTIYELVEDNTQFHKYSSLISEYNKGLEAYKKQEFTIAKQHFEAVLAHHPKDGPSLYYLELIQHCLENPTSFSLVIKMETK